MRRKFRPRPLGDAGQGPHFVDIRAGKGEQAAILRVGQRREGPTASSTGSWSARSAAVTQRRDRVGLRARDEVVHGDRLVDRVG